LYVAACSSVGIGGLEVGTLRMQVIPHLIVMLMETSNLNQRG